VILIAQACLRGDDLQGFVRRQDEVARELEAQFPHVLHGRAAGLLPVAPQEVVLAEARLLGQMSEGERVVTAVRIGEDDAGNGSGNGDGSPEPSSETSGG